MAEKKVKNPKMSQTTLFEIVRKNEKEEPASELMKVIAEKIPSKKKILRDFSPAEQAEVFERIQRGRGATKNRSDEIG